MSKFSDGYIKIRDCYYHIIDSSIENSFCLVNVNTNEYLTVDGRTLVDATFTGNIKKCSFLLKEEPLDKISIHYQGVKANYSAFLRSQDFRLSIDNKSVFDYSSSNNVIVKTLQNVDLLHSKIKFMEELFIRNFPVNNVPTAVGKQRRYQLETLNLLIEFYRLCDQIGIKFWITGGTVLGAVRHKGFIPWDDDVDVCMVLDDFEKLKKYFEENCRFISASSESELKVMQSNLDGLALFDFHPYTYKLKMLHRGEFNPFIDIFVLYYKQVDKTVDELYSLFKQLNKDSKKYLKDNGVEKYRSYLCEELKNISSRTSTDSLFFGLQTYRKKFDVRNTNDIFPLVKLNFEGHLFFAAKNYFEWLNNHYGDIYLYPKSFSSHLFE